jgi:hypothetical protein
MKAEDSLTGASVLNYKVKMGKGKAPPLQAYGAQRVLGG